MVGFEKNSVQRRLDVVIPQDFSREATADGPRDDLPHHTSPRQVEPDNEVSAIRKLVPNYAVLPFGHPLRSRTEFRHVCFERFATSPVRTVVQGVDLDVFDTERA